ncbi:hypothetical protein GCM10010399_50330 [Dactylosporangium fulvum]|uniref:Uncharacterized protein n=1 Tax=Dactylosporangium fulvum TaxID=53359 RepID=A0ABY5WCY2_9ACTN|nr:hypothetical protein [Dactylosporangium fulvum]UWP86066.1 hypothetical protein Dfulv_18215 [Dactylosporangium fulvum]
MTMFKLNRTLPAVSAVGAVTLFATLVGAPAHAAGRPGDGGTTFGAQRAKKPAAACKELTVNGGFETPKLGTNQDWALFDENDVPAWRTDDPKGQIEIWDGGQGVQPRFGKQFAELNATGSGNSIYQDIKTKPNTKIYWSFWIRARDTSGARDVEATQIHFGRTPKNGGSVNGVGSTFAYRNSADDVRWKRLYGWYKTGSNQTSTRVTLTAVESASTDAGYGNLVDGLTIVENPKCI